MRALFCGRVSDALSFLHVLPRVTSLQGIDLVSMSKNCQWYLDFLLLKRTPHLVVSLVDTTTSTHFETS